VAVASAGVRPAGALTVALDPETMFILAPPNPVSVGIQLDENWTRLSEPGVSNPGGADDFDVTYASEQLPGPSVPLDELSADNAFGYKLTVTFTWKGTVNGVAPEEGEYAPKILFAVVDDRWGNPTTNVSILGGFDTFVGDDIQQGPFWVQDAENGAGLHEDVYGGNPIGDLWAGVLLDLEVSVQTFMVNWYLAQDVSDIAGLPLGNGNQVRIPVAAFVMAASTPEPASALLVASGLVALAAIARRRA
jgi:hypothetical protein